MRLGYVIIYVSDVLATVEFYENAFGLLRRLVHESGQYAEMETGTTVLAFANESFVASSSHAFRPNRPAQLPAGAEVALVTDNVPAAFARSIAAGAVAVIRPMTMPSGQIVACVHDLNGFLIELCGDAIPPARKS